MMSEGGTAVNQPPDGQSEQQAVNDQADGVSEPALNPELASHMRESSDGAENAVMDNAANENSEVPAEGNAQPDDQNQGEAEESTGKVQSDETGTQELAEQEEEVTTDANNNNLEVNENVERNEEGQDDDRDSSLHQNATEETKDGQQDKEDEHQTGEDMDVSQHANQGDNLEARPVTAETEDTSVKAQNEERGSVCTSDMEKSEANVTNPKRSRPNSDSGLRYQEHDGEVKQENKENEEAKVEAEISKATESPVPTLTPATQVRPDNRKHTTTPADDSGLVQPILPAIPRGQAKVQQIATSISHARSQVDAPPTIQPVRNRVPPKLVRLATVTVSPAKARPVPKGPSLYYEEPRKPQKVITWEEATNARPPLRIDMEGPGPCSYSPTNKPLNETNAPSYTFGTKCYPEKVGGSRTSWGKSWFQSGHLWHRKADFAREGLWPSPNHYPKASLLGPRQRTMVEAPSFTFGHKSEFSIVKPGTYKEPSPNDYERQNADKLILRRAPSFTHQFRCEGTVLWGLNETNPGPAAYTPRTSPRVHKSSFTIQGIRREKSHILGPYSTL